MVVFVIHVNVADDVWRLVVDVECFSEKSFGFVGREIDWVERW